MDRVFPPCYSHQVVQTHGPRILNREPRNRVFAGTLLAAPMPGLSRMGLAAACDGSPFRRKGKVSKPIERLVPVSFTHCCASTPGLSTWWSSTALKRDLVSREASRLDAFSGYPFRTWLPGGAAGATTGPPEARPPRSSRTRGSSSQVSFTHGR